MLSSVVNTMTVATSLGTASNSVASTETTTAVGMAAWVIKTLRSDKIPIFRLAVTCAIEHLTAEHLEKLFQWLPKSINWMYLCAPIQDSTTTEDWKDYGGTHILEIGWEQVLGLLPDFKLVDSGEQFRWLERKAS